MDGTEKPDGVLSAAEVAGMLGMSERTVRNYAAAGVIVCLELPSLHDLGVEVILPALQEERER